MVCISITQLPLGFAAKKAFKSSICLQSPTKSIVYTCVIISFELPAISANHSALKDKRNSGVVLCCLNDFDSFQSIQSGELKAKPKAKPTAKPTVLNRSLHHRTSCRKSRWVNHQPRDLVKPMSVWAKMLLKEMRMSLGFWLRATYISVMRRRIRSEVTFRLWFTINCNQLVNQTVDE